MNQYDIRYVVQGSGAGVATERVQAASDNNARELVRSRYGQGQVQVQDSRLVQFGGGNDERRDGKR
jgi:hypothetical protein